MGKLVFVYTSTIERLHYLQMQLVYKENGKSAAVKELGGLVTSSGWSSNCGGNLARGKFCAGVNFGKASAEKDALPSGWHKLAVKFEVLGSSTAFEKGICLDFPAFRTLKDFSKLQISSARVCCHS